MGSKFENFDIGRRIAALLRIKDTKNFPTELNTDQLQPVVVAGTIDTVPSVNGATVAGVTLGGLSSVSVPIVQAGPDATYVPLFNSKDSDCLITSLVVTIAYDVAGAIADNGKYVMAQPTQVYIPPPGNPYYAIDSSLNIPILTGTLGYYLYALGGFQNSNDPASSMRLPRGGRAIYVPQGQSLLFTIGRQTGNFPANTVYSINALCLQAPPGGLPFYN